MREKKKALLKKLRHHCGSAGIGDGGLPFFTEFCNYGYPCSAVVRAGRLIHFQIYGWVWIWNHGFPHRGGGSELRIHLSVFRAEFYYYRISADLSRHVGGGGHRQHHDDPDQESGESAAGGGAGKAAGKSAAGGLSRYPHSVDVHSGGGLGNSGQL